MPAPPSSASSPSPRARSLARAAASSDQDLEATRRSQLRRCVFLSAFAHGLVIAALLWMPTTPPAELPGVVTVDLVAMAAPAAAGKPASLPKPVRPNPLPPTPAAAKPEPVPPAPKAAEVPKPAPPKPEPPKPEPPKPPPPPPKNETVIPKTPEKEPEKPKEKPEPKAKPEPKPPPKEVAKAEPPKPAPAKPPPPKPQESYDDVLAGLRAERGESRPDRVERPTTANAATPGAGGTATAPGVRASGSASVTPEVAAWLRAARLHVRQAWVLPAGLRRELLETQIEVELDAQGNVLSEPKLVRRSGNPWYDESVVRAVQKASPLPPPPEAGTWPFVFKPEDLG